MTDSTSELRICPNCNKEYIPKNGRNKVNQIFCDYECYKEYKETTIKVNKAKEISKIKKEYESHGWKRTNLGWISKYFELFGRDFSCDLCGKTLDENMEEHGTPLHVTLSPGVTNHMVMDSGNWIRMCSDCYYEIEYRKRSNDKKK